jgi:integrase
MARTVRDVRLDNRAARARLAPRKKAYFRVIETGKAIGYYRGLRVGSWLARSFEGGKYLEKKLGVADDMRDANGADVLTFADAQTAARQWFDELARAEHGGHVGPYSFGQACDAYLADYIRRGGKDESGTRSRLIRIKAALGSVEVRKLTSQQIKGWHSSISDSGPLTRSQSLDAATGERQQRPVDRRDREAVRRRLASANRLLTVLKAALNHAFQEPPVGVTIPSKSAWQAVSPHRGADAPKVRYLIEAEVIRLLNACPADFREIVAAALLTGARYGELCRLRVCDFDAEGNALRIEISKSGKPRSIALTNEGVRHFSRLALGKGRDALLLVRNDGLPWHTSHQLRRMANACQAAKIAPAISFHILRHTYGSRLAMRGAPMPVIAAQLGHSDTRMTERHYAHLGPSYISGVVRELMGDIGVPATATTVVALAAPEHAA